ncbi:amidohydrolase family protein [Actinomycetospora sp. C-140]
MGEVADAEVIDLGDSTLLPGLIDVHTHLSFPGDMRLIQQVTQHDTEGMLEQGRAAAAALLAAGITTVRDLGAVGDVVYRLAEEVAAGQTPGPQIVASTAQLTSVGGPNAPLGGGCDDLTACLERIDADVARGAHVRPLPDTPPGRARPSCRRSR